MPWRKRRSLEKHVKGQMTSSFRLNSARTLFVHALLHTAPEAPFQEAGRRKWKIGTQKSSQARAAPRIAVALAAIVAGGRRMALSAGWHVLNAFLMCRGLPGATSRRQLGTRVPGPPERGRAKHPREIVNREVGPEAGAGLSGKVTGWRRAEPDGYQVLSTNRGPEESAEN